MTGIEETNEAQATTLCKSCGLCCTGHLFAWVKLKPSELDPAERLGLRVFRSDPTQRGFAQPCPLWKGECTIYHTPEYPRFCRAYRCKLLKALAGEQVLLSGALAVVEQAKGMIRELEPVIPACGDASFRERLVAALEHPQEAKKAIRSYEEFRRQVEALLRFFEAQFGVTDFLD